MSSQQKSEAMQDQEKQTVEFLRNHPHFFETNTELLAELELSHGQSGNRISLIERQVKVLRDQSSDLKAHLQELINIARDNDTLHSRLNKLTLALLAVEDRTALTELLKRQLHEDFAADCVALNLLEGEIPADWQELYDSAAKFGVKCGSTGMVNKGLLFGEMADGIESLALISLGEYGLLAIGSHDKEHFHKGVATDYLKQLAGVIKAMLGRLS